MIDIIEQIVLGEIPTEGKFIRKIRNEYQDDADKISVAISNYVDLWTKKIMNDFSDKKIIIIPFTGPRAALGPVASILRGIFPDKIIITKSEGDNIVVFELRARNDTPLNLADVLVKVASKVPVINCGGHPPAAGALVRRSEEQAFTEGKGQA